MKYYFYSRISTIQQNSSRQIETFKNHDGFDTTKLFIERIQGNIPFMQRPEALKMFNELTNESELCTVIVDSIDRVGRNLIDILNTIELFTRNKICLKSIKEGFTTLLDNGEVNPMAQLVISCMGSISELSRNQIKSRSMEGIRIAQALGKYTGRKHGSTQSVEKTLHRHADVVLKLKRGLTVRDVSAITGKSSATITNVRRILVKRNEI